MSRTYREIPHFVTKESLIKDFNEGLYRIFHCGSTFNNANHYAKAAMAKERSDASVFNEKLLSEVTHIAPNGSPLGYNEWSRSRWAKQFANKARRSNDKAVIAEALAEVDEVDLNIQELNYDYGHWQHYDDWLLANGESPDWDNSWIWDEYYPDDHRVLTG